MLSIIISAVAATVVGILCGGLHWAWQSIIFFFTFIVCFGGLNFWFGRRLKAITLQMQASMEGAKAEAMRMAQRFQTQPIGNAKVMQDRIEKVISEGIREALPLLEQAKPLYKWTPLAEKQVATIQFQLNYQLKKMDVCKELIGKILALDPLTVSMKLAVMNDNGASDEELEKFYAKSVKRFKYEKALLVYATYSWILARRKNEERLVEVLGEAKDKTEHEVMARNWQLAANGKSHNLSFAALGEEWYALNLEKPPKQKATKGQMKNNPLMPKGKRKYR